jgi:hypothetical protein
MDSRAQTVENDSARSQPVDPGSGPGPRQTPPTPPGSTLNIGPILAQTIRHFFPDFRAWIDNIKDPRDPLRITYSKHFLIWFGLMLFVCKLSSRRQANYHLNADGPEVLHNLNRLAGTNQTTCPVDKTLEYFCQGIGSDGLIDLRHQAVNRLIRMKVLDQARLQGEVVILVDGSGYLVFHERHCEHCLTQKHGNTTLYMHQVLEGKLLGPGGTVFSIATEFIDNRDVQDSPAGASAERLKQDCELKALRRLLDKLRREYPQLRICLSGDSLFGCGEGFQIAKDYHCDYIYVFKPGRTPALWADFQGLLKLCPNQYVQATTPKGTRQEYRWVNGLRYTDSDGRNWTMNAIQCEEIDKDGNKTTWAWLTPLKVTHETVVEVSTKGGRGRWCIENEGYNTQKNSGLNLEHAYSHKAWEVYYLLLQIAHMLLQLVEKGSLLQELARQCAKKTALALFGSLKGMAIRLLESLRYCQWPESAFAEEAARKMQIRLNSS